MSCVICHRNIQEINQRYLIDGKGKLNVRELLASLPFRVHICSCHICKMCIAKLKKRQALKQQEDELLHELECLTRSCQQHKRKQDEYVEVIESSSTSIEPEHSDVVLKRFRGEFPTPSIVISPIKSCTTLQESCLTTPSVSPGSRSLQIRSTPTRKLPLSNIRKQPSVSSAVPVSVKVQWPSETRERNLPKDLESLRKMLVRGTYKQVARSSWQNPKLRKELQALLLKEIDKECNALCSRKQPSCLRSPSKDQLQTFSFAKLNKELKDRAPLLKAILHTACVNKRNASKPDEWMPTIGMAAAVLLRNRSSRLNAVHLLLSIFLYHSSWTVCI